MEKTGGQCSKGEREVSDVNEGGFILESVSSSLRTLGLHPLVPQQLWLWFEAGQIQPLNLMGDVEKCCRCISWMQRELVVAKQEMRNPVSLN